MRPPEATAEGIDHLLEAMRTSVPPTTWASIEELLELVTELYGAGLARIVELAGQPARAAMAGDDLVASLLVLHGLHPESFTNRVERALADVRPYLATHGGDVELTGVDEELGAVRLRLLGSCDGCPSSSLTLTAAVERAIREAAPEVTLIEVEEADGAPAVPPAGTPVRLGPKPPAAYVDCPVPVPDARAMS